MSRFLPRSYLLKVAFFATGHFLLAQFILALPVGVNGIYPLWMPIGLAEAVMLRHGLKYWPGVAISTLVRYLLVGFSGWTALILAANDAVQIVLGVMLLQRAGFNPRLERLRDVVHLFTLAAILPATLSATIGILQLCAIGFISWETFNESWFAWWIGNITGVLTLLPFALTWRQWQTIGQEQQRLGEVMVWGVSLLAVSWFIFCYVDRPPYPLEYIPLSWVVWGALRFGQRGAALAIALVLNLATLGFVQHSSPFLVRAVTPHQAIGSLQAYVCVFALTALVLAAVMAEREDAKTSLQSEKEKSESLLLNILPAPIAERLKCNSQAIADYFADVTILFADIVDFTKLSASLQPEELVTILNEIFSEFDHLADRHNLEKIKTIGDSYMAVGGLPYPCQNHAQAVAEMALDMQTAIYQLGQRYQHPLQIRIGINTGPVVAGVIGTKKFIYDLWGDTVNIASRMESHGLPGRIQVTATTYAILHDRYQWEPRGSISIKGRGDMMTYWLQGHIRPQNGASLGMEPGLNVREDKSGITIEDVPC